MLSQTVVRRQVLENRKRTPWLYTVLTVTNSNLILKVVRLVVLEVCFWHCNMSPLAMRIQAKLITARPEVGSSLEDSTWTMLGLRLELECFADSAPVGLLFGTRQHSRIGTMKSKPERCKSRARSPTSIRTDPPSDNRYTENLGPGKQPKLSSLDVPRRIGTDHSLSKA